MSCPPKLLAAVVAVAASGCAPDATQGPSPADRAVYTAVVADARVTPRAGLARCSEIQDPALAGDCALHVVSAEARREDGRPAQWCGQVPAGTWRDECWFVSAEASKRRGNEAEAAGACLQAGAFRDDCAQHLWQSEVHRLIHRRGARGFAAALPDAEALHARWAPHLDAETDFSTRFWAKFYQNGFEGQGAFVDLDACDVLAEPHTERCVAAGVQMYARELRPRLDQHRVDVCGLDPQQSMSEQVGRVVPGRPDPRLDAAVSDLIAVVCD